MNRIERLEKVVTDLGNHVAAVIRMSNRMDGLLKDAKGDLSPQTKDAILRDIADMHSAFRIERFRALIANVNAAVEISRQLLAEEPVVPDPTGPEPDPQMLASPDSEPGLGSASPSVELGAAETGVDGREAGAPETPHDESDPVA